MASSRTHLEVPDVGEAGPNGDCWLPTVATASRRFLGGVGPHWGLYWDWGQAPTAPYAQYLPNGWVLCK